ncbi:hypothetical protein Pedsa_0754 [Pseudopedobacter saltans DSM 12145]|uniref:Uncharacterized protein n=1 Tax=Pseudopedobacter saltans (strain ATCC 51119 / DSM 12145 / JCM 21818 / CCUG 39354 / LMG 10337 / NBRC 100064 / NCIMB 13643) TaxID=762903 RepID=F0S929_PSESL|nr:hypothetical protein [Pseudopedobacter saltans]ADY51327.1 hypothetical protein Pedsa_0754 [Pseudopedobacter saltans DSM 12145]
MIAILTGDIINSRQVDTKLWLPLLEKALAKYALKKSSWEIYRGDSFQMETSIEQAFEAIIYIKTIIKSIQGLDVRMAVGIGEKDYEADSLKKSNGQAFVFSGETFDALQKETLKIKTPWKDLDEQLNIYLDLMAFIIHNWNANVSSTVYYSLAYKELNQAELTNKIGKKQSQISRELKKAGYDYILKTINYCQKTLIAKCTSSS